MARRLKVEPPMTLYPKLSESWGVSAASDIHKVNNCPVAVIFARIVLHKIKISNADYASAWSDYISSMNKFFDFGSTLIFFSFLFFFHSSILCCSLFQMTLKCLLF